MKFQLYLHRFLLIQTLPGAMDHLPPRRGMLAWVLAWCVDGMYAWLLGAVGPMEYVSRHPPVSLSSHLSCRPTPLGKTRAKLLDSQI